MKSRTIAGVTSAPSATALVTSRSEMIPSSSPSQTASTLARLVGRVGEEATQRFWDALAIIPTPAQATPPEALLDVAPGSPFSDLDRPRQGAGIARGTAM